MPELTPTPKTEGPTWLEPVLWTLGMIVGVVVAVCVNETAREVAVQGLAYLFAFLTTPFILEASAAFVGLFIVFAINNRRIAREGDGWVEMEVKQAPPTKEPAKGVEPAGRSTEV